MWPRPLKMLSVCSAQVHVLAAAVHTMGHTNVAFCFEATANQVNHQGGYSNLRPDDFRDMLRKLARPYQASPDSLRLGGDHLGPAPWQARPAAEAMQQATAMVAAYTRAGFAKLHLDAATPLAGDPRPLPPELIARRTAELCAVAEETFARESREGIEAPCYVIGQDVPPAGGRSVHHQPCTVTSPEAFETCVAQTRRAFEQRGLERAWRRVMAVVVNTGAEFGLEDIRLYDHQAMQPLAAAVRRHADLVLEGHSTDYQSLESLRQMVADGVGILKIGPCLTFALREVLLALGHIETHLVAPSQQSRLFNLLDAAMHEEPEHWQAYYPGVGQVLQRALRFSYLDRCRYYWSMPRVRVALTRLLLNLNQTPIPRPLISQYLPDMLPLTDNGQLSIKPEDLIRQRICRVLAVYVQALTESGPSEVKSEE